MYMYVYVYCMCIKYMSVNAKYCIWYKLAHARPFPYCLLRGSFNELHLLDEEHSAGIPSS